MIGELLIEIGAGRRVKDEEIDSQVGIKLLKQPGEMVKKYDDLFIVYSTKKPSED
jgi:thymidine phosphorylase